MPLASVRSHSAPILLTLLLVLILGVEEPGANSHKRFGVTRARMASAAGGLIEIASHFVGPSHLTRILEREGVEPVALTSGDFDEDGVADLVCGYAGPGPGILVLYRGNPDALFPNHPDAVNRGDYSAAPFLSPATVFEAPATPDLLAAGDFDADGHVDIACATRGGGLLHFLNGSGDGTLGSARAISIEGRTTALTAGEIGQVDGQPEILVAMEGSEGHWLSVFSSPFSLPHATPERIALPAKATALEIGQMDTTHEMDLAIAAGKKLFILSGSNRVLKRFGMASDISSMALASLGENQQKALALLLADGSIHVLDRGRRRQVSANAGSSSTGWLVGGDKLSLIDRLSRQVTSFAASNGQPGETVSMEMLGEPVAALSMRLNFDAQNDLVILRKGQVTPAASLTPAATFVVDNPGDAGGGSLRDAINQANNIPGADVITFNIAGPQPIRINLASALPPITDALSIDGSSQPGFTGTPLIEIDASAVAGTANGLTLTAANCNILGLSINGAGGSGIVSNGANNIIQGCFIGTDIAGAAVDATPNAGNGIVVNGATNTIGGTALVSRNLISGNGANGVLIQGAAATGIVVLGNFIGTNLAGAAAIPNAGSGVSITGIGGLGNPSNNTVGGTTAAARNVISGNGVAGVTISNGAAGSVVHGNFIGPTSAGTVAIGNNNGVAIATSTGNSIGGATAATANVIAFNKSNGVAVSAGTANSIRRNSIFSNAALGIDLGAAGVTPNDVGDADVGANNLQNFPVIQGAAQSGGGTLVLGSLNSTPSTTFILEFFANPTCDASGFGEGQTFVGTLTVNTDASGNVNFTTTFPTAVPLDQSLTATATDPAGNTSEFSACSQVGNPSDLTITKTATPATVVTGTNITYTITVTNTGPGRALSVTVTDLLPPQTVFVSCTAGSGGVCQGTGNQRTVFFAGLDAATSAVITLVARADCTQLDGTVITNTATVSAATPDSNPLNNSATATVNGAPQVRSDKASVDLGPARARFRQRTNKGPSDIFFLESTGCTATQVTAVQIARTGSDVDGGKINNTDDSGSWALFLINPNESETLLNVPSQLSLAIPAGRQQRFRIRFTPVIPDIAGSNTGLSADQVTPARLDSRLTFTTNSGQVAINLTGRVVAGPRLLTVPALSKSGSQRMSVRTQIWDADNNVRRLVFRFVGSRVPPEISVDVASAIQARNLVTGQSFAVIVDFEGDNEGVTGVQVTVVDDSGSSETGGATPAVTPQSLTHAGNPLGVSVSLGPVKLRL